MGTAKKKATQVRHHIGKTANKTLVAGYSLGRKTVRTSTLAASHASKKTAHIYKEVHHRYAHTPHRHLMQTSSRYAAWHSWNFKQLHHGHVHLGILASYVLVVGTVVLNVVSSAFAADLSDTWNFSTPATFELSNNVEINGTSARLKAQEYEPDGNTAALYHFNETNGSQATDTSPNANTVTLHGSPTFDTGNLNNALTLNGANQFGDAADSPSLSVTGQQSLEAWIKPDATFDKNSTQSQTILDKASYRLGLDRTSGKAFYEIQNSDSEQWTKRLGNDQNGSWSFNHVSVESNVAHGGNIYVGIGSSTGDGEVWKWNGSTWTMIGGDGVNSSWANQTYETVSSLAVNGNTLFAGLGSGGGDGEVWSCNLSSGCSSWSKIGGDGTGIGTVNSITSLTVSAGTLYAGTTGSAGAADLYRYDGGTSWTQIGGDGINSSWAASTYESVLSMTSDGTDLYAGLGTTTGDAEVWKLAGSVWSKIGGDGVSSSWNTNYETIESLTYFGGNLYAGLGNTSGVNDGEVWRYSSGSWAQIGGDGVNSSWSATVINQTFAMTNDGTNLYVGLGSGTSAGLLYRWNGSAWTQIGGTGVADTWSTNSVKTLVYTNSKLYTGVSGSSGTTVGSSYWSYDGSNWTLIGGAYINDSWGGYGITRVNSSTVMDGKAYFGTSGSAGMAYVYEYDGTTARRIGGNNMDGSWAPFVYTDVKSLIAYKGQLYAGLGTSNTSGTADLFRWNGSSWTQVGGDGINGTWGVGSERLVGSMAVFNGKLYVGLGNNSGHGDIWSYDGSTWAQIGGDGINSSWTTNPRGVESMAVYDGKLCAALGGSGAWGEVWCWPGTGSWIKIGGGNNQSTNGSWSSSALVGVLTTYKGKLYAGIQGASHNVTVWSWDGTSWTEVGGEGLNGTWGVGDYTYARSMAVYNGELYFGLSYSGSSNPTGDVWRWNGSTWVQVGGDGINNGWAAAESREEVASLVTYKGKLYAGLGYSANNDALVYSFGNNAYAESNTSSFGTDWTHLAATYDGVNMKFYVNGTLDATRAVSATGVDNDIPLQIGAGFGSEQAGSSQGFFKGKIDEVRISNTARTSFTSKAYSAAAQSITLGTAARTSGVESWDGFSADEVTDGGTITYRLSDDDGVTWQYWDGNNWGASSGPDQATSANDINAHIGDFPVTFSGIRWQAILKGDGSQRVQLNSVTLTTNSDSDDPINASDITMHKTNGGDAVTSNAWTNAATPYFAWTDGSDSGAGILGYCLYLGTSSNADPAITKGLLGTNPVSTGGNCQFAVSTSSIDLSTNNYLSSALTTNNSPYYLIVKAIDKAGNVSSDTEQFQFRFDNTPPHNPGFITAPSQFVSSKEVTFTWPTTGPDAPSDDHSGLSGLQYRIGPNSSWYGDGVNGAGLLANDGNYSTREDPDYANINEGNNIVYFRVWDQAGNVSTNYATAALKLNTTSPASPQNVTATPTTNTINNFGFSWATPATFSGSAGAITYCYTVNVLPTANTCTYTEPGTTSLPAGAYATQPGDNTFYVVAKDEAGNINYATAASTTFSANTPAPGMPLDIDIADVSVKATSSWKLALTWERPSDVGTGVSNYKVLRSTNNTSFLQVATTSGTSYVDSNLNQVRYYYKVQACDSANNCGAFSSVVSSTPTGKFTTPAALTAQPSVPSTSTKKATIQWATDRDSDSKIALGTKPGQYDPFQVASSEQVTDHRVELTNLTPGTTYYAKAVWTDEDGNTGASSEFSFKTEPAPSTQEVATQHVTLSSAQIRFTSISAAKVVIQYGKSDNFGGVKEVSTSLSKSTYDIELAGLDDGSKYFYRLNTFDAEGNEYTGSTVLTFTTPARPRIENLRFQPVKGEPTSTQQITWRTNVPTSSLVRFSSGGNAGKETSDSKLVTEHEVVVRNLLDDTEYNFVAESRDSDGNLAVSDTHTLKTALDTRPPKITDVTVETTIRGTGAEARGQVVVSWKTDEPATSQVAYAQGSSATVFNNKTSEDTGLSLEHIVIVSDLPTSRVYSVQPISQDRSGNAGTGESKAAIIGRASDSVMTVILNTLRKVFGF